MPDLFYILRGYLCALTTATVTLQGHIRSLGYCLHLEYLYLIWLQTIHTAFLFTMSYFLLRYWQGTMYLLVSAYTCILSGYQTLNHEKYSLKLNSLDHQFFHRVAIQKYFRWRHCVSQNTALYFCQIVLTIQHIQITIVIFIHYKPRIAVAILDL